MKRLIVLLSIFAASWAGASETARYVATPTDTTVSELVSRWAALDGRDVKWEAMVDLPIPDATRLNAKASLSSASNLGDAFGRIAKTAHQAKPDAPVLFGCAYKTGRVALVVRQVGQPACGAPLR